ncbi:MAG TPA: M56 family metallopeptidase [Allosphingosinicella sp.]|nr:M56 family metallopeptidase [Allosphingosinicella sp.]
MTDALSAAQFGLAPALASALLDSLWQNALLGLAAALALGGMARVSARRRHAVAMAFLIAMVLVPAYQFLRFWTESGAQINAGLVPAMTAPQLGPGASVFVQKTAALAPLLVLAWVLGVAVMLLRHVAALRGLTAIERHPYEALPPQWRRRVEEIRTALGIARSVSVRLSAEVLTPFAARLVRPAIWLPLGLLTRTPAAQLEALLAHELAHIARKDWLWNGIQCVVECLLFFHPAVWWLGRRIRQEREHACDDLAVAACGDPIALAEALAALECDRNPSTRLALAANGGSLMKRITRLLSGPPSRGRWGALASLGALTVAGLVLITQVGAAGLPDLNVESSTAGELGPGDYRQITANGLDKRRFYRISLDAQGRRTETYQENGEARPIDAGVRRWIAEVTRLGVPPAPPALPDVDDMPEHRALVALIASHPDVVARVGSPAAATSRPVNGNVRLTGSEGDADIEIELGGPRGRVTVEVQAERRNGAWRLDSLEPR